MSVKKGITQVESTKLLEKLHVLMREAVKNMASLEVAGVCCVRPMCYVEPTATVLR